MDGPRRPPDAGTAAENNTGPHHRRIRVGVCISVAVCPSIPRFVSPLLMKGLHPYNTTQAGQSEKHSSSPALSPETLRNKWALKYFPATGPPFFFLHAGLLVKRVCLRCFVKELLFHPSLPPSLQGTAYTAGT